MRALVAPLFFSLVFDPLVERARRLVTTSPLTSFASTLFFLTISSGIIPPFPGLCLFWFIPLVTGNRFKIFVGWLSNILDTETSNKEEIKKSIKLHFFLTSSPASSLLASRKKVLAGERNCTF